MRELKFKDLLVKIANNENINLLKLIRILEYFEVKEDLKIYILEYYLEESMF